MKKRSFDERVVSYGKPKATVIHIALGLFTLSILTVIHSLIFYHNIYNSFTNNVSFLLFATALVVVNSLRSYDEAVDKIKQAKELKLKGLTTADINNISFVNSWRERKENGFYKYILFNGGVMLGSLIFLILSFVCFPKAPAEGRQFPEFSDMINYMVKCYGAGFALGMLLCAINWHFSERRFKRLTAANILEG